MNYYYYYYIEDYKDGYIYGNMAGDGAFKTVRVSGNFGGWDLKIGGNRLEHSVGSEISLRTLCGSRATRASELTSEQWLPISLID